MSTQISESPAGILPAAAPAIHVPASTPEPPAAPSEKTSTPPEPRNLQLEDSLPGKICRRWTFATRYFTSRTQLDTIRKFEPIVQRNFQHDWLAGTRLRFRFIPGNEDREFRIRWRGGKNMFRFRWLPWREENCPAKWGGPVAVTVLKKGKEGCKPETVRYMSFFIKDGIIHILQLQGVPLIEMPKGLRDWADRFVKAAMEFAREQNFRGVWVARAESLYSYHHPWLWSKIPLEIREREMKRIRTSMEFYHNETAKTLGFTPEEEWFKWKNPEHKQNL